MAKILSLIVLIISSVIFYFTSGIEISLYVFGFSCFPLIFIWFGDLLGEYTTGLVGHPVSQITSKSPGWMVKMCGWILLFLPLVIGLMIKIGT